ncbi:hypothetical protein DL768_001117 [Monosporascus sp. mg162]|nr:hypothetical protein DL768_001117 [Monosporascus sp. mg162]
MRRTFGDIMRLMSRAMKHVNYATVPSLASAGSYVTHVRRARGGSLANPYWNGESGFEISVTYPDSNEQEMPQSGIQPSTFSPLGEFHYQIQPSKEWNNMRQYSSFSYKDSNYFEKDFVFVNSEGLQLSEKSDEDLVAKILEIRASDEHHIYARVCWYSPDELPSGRQSYQGQHEVIALNRSDRRYGEMVNNIGMTQDPFSQLLEDFSIFVQSTDEEMRASRNRMSGPKV